uniref:Secreted protein n=1 Tax=Macrostomum lignano TaxID=282301 RepID=A0A1I8IQW1_9PLAT
MRRLVRWNTMSLQQLFLARMTLARLASILPVAKCSELKPRTLASGSTGWTEFEQWLSISQSSAKFLALTTRSRCRRSTVAPAAPPRPVRPPPPPAPASLHRPPLQPRRRLHLQRWRHRMRRCRITRLCLRRSGRASATSQPACQTSTAPEAAESPIRVRTACWHLCATPSPSWMIW